MDSFNLLQFIGGWFTFVGIVLFFINIQLYINFWKLKMHNWIFWDGIIDGEAGTLAGIFMTVIGIAMLIVDYIL